MLSSCDICWHQKCFSRSAEAMVLIIQPRSEQRWAVNEKYIDSDLCKVSQPMTELTNSSLGAGKAGHRGKGPCCSGYIKRTFYPSESSGCRVMDVDRVRKVKVVPNSCLYSRSHSCRRRRKPQAWALHRHRGSWHKSKGLTPLRVWRNFYNGNCLN